MNKTEQRVTINKQNKAEKTNTISFLINTDVELFCSQGDGMWLSCKWKEEYDCPDICRNWYVYNFISNCVGSLCTDDFFKPNDLKEHPHDE